MVSRVGDVRRDGDVRLLRRGVGRHLLPGRGEALLAVAVLAAARADLAAARDARRRARREAEGRHEERGDEQGRRAAVGRLAEVVVGVEGVGRRPDVSYCVIIKHPVLVATERRRVVVEVVEAAAVVVVVVVVPVPVRRVVVPPRVVVVGRVVARGRGPAVLAVRAQLAVAVRPRVVAEAVAAELARVVALRVFYFRVVGVAV